MNDELREMNVMLNNAAPRGSPMQAVHAARNAAAASAAGSQPDPDPVAAASPVGPFSPRTPP